MEVARGGSRVRARARLAVAALAVLLVGGEAAGRQSAPPDGGQSGRLENPVKDSQLLALPRRDRGPRITLRRALLEAEKLLKRRRVDLSSCYLFEARWVADELDAEPAWRFWWVGVRGKGRSGDDVRVVVSEGGKARLAR